MALDPIWKQQLTLVTYGNEYLSHGLSVQQWRELPIFDEHVFAFRDLMSQHLLAQHFQSVFKIAAHAFTCSLSFFHMNILCRRLPIAYILHNCLAEIPVGNHGGNVCGNLFCAAQAALRF